MISYEPLRILFAKRKIKTARDVATLLDCSTRTAAKLFNDDPVSLDIINKACDVFDIGVADVIEYKKDQEC